MIDDINTRMKELHLDILGSEQRDEIIELLLKDRFGRHGRSGTGNWLYEKLGWSDADWLRNIFESCAYQEGHVIQTMAGTVAAREDVKLDADEALSQRIAKKLSKRTWGAI